jgi:iron complex outermembrane receptor protein/vitamin B12 transporter
MLFSLTLSVLVSSFAQAQNTELGAVEEVSQSSYETTVRGSSFQSTSKVIIDEDTIKKSKAPNLGSLLATQANISVASTSLQPNTIFLRGGDSGHLLILIDGLPYFDSSTSQRTTNLNSLDIKSIRRIEILKGPQSVLYGGQALTGVIRIETFPLQLKSKIYAAVEGGNLGYGKASASGLGANSAGDLAVFGHGQSSQKMTPSPVKNSAEVYPTYMDGADLALMSRKKVVSFAKVSQTNERTDLSTTNQATYEAADTKDLKFANRVASAMAGVSLPDSFLRPRFLVGQQNSVRTYEQGSSSTNQLYAASLTNLRLEADAISDESKNLLVGASYLKERFIYRNLGVENNDEFNEQRGAFAKWSHDFGSLFGYELGVRTDYINHQDRADSIQIGLSILEKVKLEYATGFKTASLFQLYGLYGNADLKPEKAKTYSLTYDDNSDNESFSTTLFDTSFDDLIAASGAPPATRYYNLSRTQTRGIETSYSVVWPDQLRTNLSLGYQEPRDITNAKWLPRRPLVTASIGVVKAWEKNSTGADIIYSGDRTDASGSTSSRQLASHTTVNVNYSRQMTTDFSIYARVNNLTDQKFEQTTGYYDEGIFALVGLEFLQ